MRRHSGIEANHFYYVHGWTHRAQPIRFLFTLETLKEWNRVRDETKATDTPHYIIDTSDAALDKTPRICARVQVDVFCIIDNKILYRRSLNCVRALFGGLFAQVFSVAHRWFHPVVDGSIWWTNLVSLSKRRNGFTGTEFVTCVSRHLIGHPTNRYRKNYIPLTDESSVRICHAHTCRKYKLLLFFFFCKFYFSVCRRLSAGKFIHQLSHRWRKIVKNCACNCDLIESVVFYGAHALKINQFHKNDKRKSLLANTKCSATTTTANARKKTEQKKKNQFQLNYLTNAYARARSRSHADHRQARNCVFYFLSPPLRVSTRTIYHFFFCFSHFILSFLVSCLVS